MRILILGGTRFLGRKVVENLLIRGHDLTVLSRRKTNLPTAVRFVLAERVNGLNNLVGENFDIVLDFICYNEIDIKQLTHTINMKQYILISTIWVSKLKSCLSSNKNFIISKLTRLELPIVTKNYLLGKICAEAYLPELNKRGIQSVALRLPIVLGNGDHTGRLEFYCRRLLDGGPLIIINSGKNTVQIASLDDIAKVIVLWLENIDITIYPIWDALPGKGRNVFETLNAMSVSLGYERKFINISSKELEKKFPEYLKHEPFWREEFIKPSSANIFNITDVSPELFGDKIKYDHKKKFPTDFLRKQELKFIENRKII